MKPLFATETVHTSPYGEYFFAGVGGERVLFSRADEGKVAVAGSMQRVTDSFHPARRIHVGTCGGAAGRINRFDVVAPERVVIYHIAPAVGDSKEAIAEYSTSLSLPARLPVPAVKATMYSADRDLTAAGLRELNAPHRPVVADWEWGPSPGSLTGMRHPH